MFRAKTILPVCLVLAPVCVVYLGHFQNGFHFDDIHTITGNPYIRDLHNVPKFFTDARTFSILPSNRMYRPLISTSLAFDYWLGGTLNPFYFQLSTFCWFLVQLVLMYALFRKICDAAFPDPRNRIVALFAVAWYGLHPAMAETVNYVIQRADLYSTLGVIAGILIYASSPKLRKFGLYLMPVSAAILSKAPALVFPALLFVYIWLFEEDRWRRVFLKSTPALVLCAALGWLTTAMTPKTFHGGAVSAYAYRITQPLVALRYFRTFFMPGGLTADTDLAPIPSIWKDWAWLGFLFIIAIIALAAWCSRMRETRPIAFGLWWFLIALLPTSIFPLAEVENDHRMFFPFVGLVLSASWPVALWIYRYRPRQIIVRGVIVLASFELVILAFGTLQRNIVWRTEESLWQDVTIKSPKNSRGILNYAVAEMNKGTFEAALADLNRAKTLAPRDSLVDLNLAVASGKLQRPDTEDHFRVAVQRSFYDPRAHFWYAKWLEETGRRAEAIEELRIAVKVNPDYLDSMYLLMEVYAKRESWKTVRGLADIVLKRFPKDDDARAYLLMSSMEGGEPGQRATADTLLNVSAIYYQIGKLEKSMAAARDALRLRPNYPEAYNNISAAYRGLGNWDLAIEAAQQALKIRPTYKPALHNLALAQQQK